VDGKPYVPTPDEQRVLDECRGSALMRGSIYGAGGTLLAYSLLRYGSKGRMGVGRRLVLGTTGMASFAIGMFSYSARCAEQLIALEGSPMGESLKKAMEARGVPPPGQHQRAGANKGIRHPTEALDDPRVNGTHKRGARESWDSSWETGASMTAAPSPDESWKPQSEDSAQTKSSPAGNIRPSNFGNSTGGTTMDTTKQTRDQKNHSLDREASDAQPSAILQPHFDGEVDDAGTSVFSHYPSSTEAKKKVTYEDIRNRHRLANSDSSKN